MTRHICIIFTTTILGVHIYSTTSQVIVSPLNYTVFTGVNNLSAVSGARTCVSRVRSTAECRCLFSRTDMQLWRVCAVRCMRFLAYFLHFRCLNTNTLSDIDVKIRFCAVVTASCFAAILRRRSGHFSSSARVPGISVYIFSCNCTVQARNYGTVQFWRQAVKSVLLWWFPHPLLLRKCRCLFS